MRSGREAVAVALFNLLGGAYAFATKTRTPTLPENVPAGDQPYFGLELLDEEDTQNEGVGITTYTLNFRAYFYARADADPDVAGETFLNRLLDAIDTALQNPLQPGERVTLGNLVYHAWIEGMLARSNGLIDKQMWLVVPIKAITGI